MSGQVSMDGWTGEVPGSVRAAAGGAGHRNRGIATRLIEAAIVTFREMGLREVEIDVEVVKRGAIRLYENVGFRTIRGIPMDENKPMSNENGRCCMMKMEIN